MQLPSLSFLRPTAVGNTAPRVRVEETGIIDAPIEQVWAIVRDFAAGSRWLPGVQACDVENGHQGTTIGAVRRLTLTDGRWTRERLLGLSDVRFLVELMIVETALPVRDYVATFLLSPISEGEKCLFSWKADFEADPENSYAIAQQLRMDVFRPGFERLRKILGRPDV